MEILVVFSPIIEESMASFRVFDELGFPTNGGKPFLKIANQCRSDQCIFGTAEYEHGRQTCPHMVSW